MWWDFERYWAGIMVHKILKTVRNNKVMMCLLSAIYRFIGLNCIRGRKGLKIYWTSVFSNRIKIINHGSGNLIEFGEGCRLSRCKIRIFGNGNRIKIEQDCVCKEMDIWISDGGIIEIGHNTHFVGAIHIACTEGKMVKVGERCLFSSDIVIRTGDSHSILDSKGHRINPAADIFIGDHVWIGQQVVLLKGADIGEESVIGANSLVTGKKFRNHSVLAGNPAKIIIENITWHHSLG